MDDQQSKDRAFSDDGSSFVLSDRDDSIDSGRRRSLPQDEAENRYFGQAENRRVRGLKALVFIVLLLVTLAVCLSIFLLTAAGQQHEFEAS